MRRLDLLPGEQELDPNPHVLVRFTREGRRADTLRA
jgi:hypothetical protein